MILNANQRRAPALLRVFLSLALSALPFWFSACAETPLGPEGWALRVEIEAGDEWTHPFPLLGPITKPNYPTFALWVADEAGTYLDTLFVTAKIGKAAWIMADDSRPEALPLWSKVRGGQPSAATPAPDAVCGATPRASQAYALTRGSLPERVYLWLEINHSVDYDEFYREGILDEAHAYYSGGTGGSGQPALVYRALVDFSAAPGTRFPFELVGHSEPGGAWSGTDYYSGGLAMITSAKRIVSSAAAILR